MGFPSCPERADEPPPPSRRFLLIFLLLLGVYLGGFFLLRLSAPEGLYLDEAEQLVLMQSLDWGYGMQPPLYTWLVVAVSQVCGPSLLSLALVKILLLGAFYLFLFLAARRVLTDARLWFLAAFAFLLVPFFAWDVHQLTHSLLLCVVCAAMLYVVVRLVESGRAIHYAALGLVVGLGGLSKYNFEVFFLALVAAGLTVREVRARLVHPKSILTLLLAAVWVVPHLGWLIQHWDRVSVALTGRAGVTETAGFWWARGLGLFNLTTGLFLTAVPLVVGLGLCFGRPRQRPLVGASDVMRRWLDRYLIALVVVLLLHTLVGGVTRFFPRWLAPFLVPLPVWFFLRLPTLQAGSWRPRLFAGLVLAAAVMVFAGRCLDELVWRSGRFRDRDQLTLAVAERLRADGFERGLVVADDHVLAGKARLLFAKVGVACPGLSSALAHQDWNGDPCVLIWSTTRGQTLPVEMKPFVTDRLRALKRGGRPAGRPAVVGGLHYLILPPVPPDQRANGS